MSIYHTLSFSRSKQHTYEAASEASSVSSETQWVSIDRMASKAISMSLWERTSALGRWHVQERHDGGIKVEQRQERQEGRRAQGRRAVPVDRHARGRHQHDDQREDDKELDAHAEYR